MLVGFLLLCLDCFVWVFKLVVCVISCASMVICVDCLGHGCVAMM